MHARLHSGAHAHTHTHTHTYACMHACTQVHTHIHTLTHSLTHAHTHTHTHTHMHTCMHAHTHSHMHMVVMVLMVMLLPSGCSLMLMWLSCWVDGGIILCCQVADGGVAQTHRPRPCGVGVDGAQPRGNHSQALLAPFRAGHLPCHSLCQESSHQG